MKIDIAGLDAALATALTMAITAWEIDERAAIERGFPRLGAQFRSQINDAMTLQQRIEAVQA